MPKPDKPVKLQVPGKPQQAEPEQVNLQVPEQSPPDLKPEPPAPQHPRPSSKPTPPARRQLRFDKLPGGIVFGLFSVLAFAYGLQAKAAGEASLHWPTTQGVVASSKVETSESTDHTVSYHIRVSYDYTAAGQQFRGHSVKYHASYNQPSLAQAQATLRNYPVGKGVTVYVNPGDPSEAVLIPGATLEGYAVMALGGVFGLFSLIFWVQAFPARTTPD